MKKDKTQTKYPNTLQCAYCVKEFKYESEKKRHEESHFPHFKCKVCSKKFSFISSLRRHEKQHDRNGNVNCEQCGGSFRDDILLKRHINYAHKGRHTCPKCNITYNSESALHSHMKIHKPEAERKYRCSYDGCKKSFNFHHHWKHHELTHMNKKQYYCNICDKGFIQLHHLKTHLKTHDPEGWIYCNINGCKKKFSNEYARKRHQATCKVRIQGGASSDSNSNCDNSVDSVQSFNGSLNNRKYSDKLLFATCNDDKLKLTNETVRILDLTVPCKTGSQILRSLSVDKNTKLAGTDEIIEMSTCKTVLGECLSRDSENSCICAQITSEVEEPYNLNPIIIDSRNTLNVSNAFDSQLNCEECECAKSCKAKTSSLKDACLKRISLSNAMPAIEYINGTVKIKETFDYDIPIVESVNENRGRNFQEDNVIGAYVLKSCEAALGKCLVSGNGTIGEGCLCAKMMLDEQVTAEEIDDITPQPNANKTEFI